MMNAHAKFSIKIFTQKTRKNGCNLEKSNDSFSQNAGQLKQGHAAVLKPPKVSLQCETL